MVKASNSFIGSRQNHLITVGSPQKVNWLRKTLLTGRETNNLPDNPTSGKLLSHPILIILIILINVRRFHPSAPRLTLFTLAFFRPLTHIVLSPSRTLDTLSASHHIRHNESVSDAMERDVPSQSSYSLDSPCSFRKGDLRFAVYSSSCWLSCFT